jgi:hypothetical protein
MSKQSELKEKQGFRKDAPNCGNCIYFSSKVETKTSYGTTFKVETELRCNIGDFKIGKSNWCTLHLYKPIEF